MIIYKVTFPNQKCYIGMTTLTLEERKVKHYRNAFMECLKTHFYNALRKYKRLETWTILDTANSIDDLKLLEKTYLERYNSFNGGYNSTLGGDGVFGYKFSKQSKQSMSEKRLGIKKSENFKNLMRLQRVGKPRSEETKTKISKTLMDRGSVRGIKNPNWNGYVVTPLGKFDTISEAAKYLGCAVTTIFYRCRSANYSDWYWSPT